MKRDRVTEVLNLLYDAEIEAEYCSPNFVASFSHDLGIFLDSSEVVSVSNYYGTEDCPTGRACELELVGD